MKVDVYPSKVFGSITPPPSKSYLHRAIISASLATGSSIINNVIYSDDVLATIQAMESIGVQIKRDKNRLFITSKGINNLSESYTINCNESGSTLRFLIPIISNEKKCVFKGKASLLKRPMKIYKTIFKNQNLEYIQTNNSIITKGKISSGNFTIPGNISSQFITGLLFLLPTLNGNSKIEVTGDFESQNYVDLTISILRKFNVFIQRNKNVFFIKGNQKYVSTTIDAETDFSQLAYFAVLGTINNSIIINNINCNSLQPDKRIIDLIISMNGNVEKDGNIAIFSKSKTFGRTIDISQSPDIAPILSLLGACSQGKTKIINAKRLIIKESNRLLSTYNSLKKLGVNVIMGKDFLEITGANILQGNIFDSYNDHRIAMMLAIAGTVCNTKITIKNAEAINKSYPHFYTDLESLGVTIKYFEE